MDWTRAAPASGPAAALLCNKCDLRTVLFILSGMQTNQINNSERNVWGAFCLAIIKKTDESTLTCLRTCSSSIRPNGGLKQQQQEEICNLKTKQNSLFQVCLILWRLFVLCGVFGICHRNCRHTHRNADTHTHTHIDTHTWTHTHTHTDTHTLPLMTLDELCRPDSEAHVYNRKYTN